MEIITKKVRDLKPYKNNPRNNKEAIDYVARSIEEFGFKVPIVIDKDNVVICGHTRLLASKRLKLKEVPCIIADDLSEEQIKAYRLADNKVSEKSEWDLELLEDELSDIFDIDMESFGFDFDLNFDDDEKEHEIHKDETQRRVENILNLEQAQYEGEGKYDIPAIEPIYELETIKEWIGFNYVLSDNDPTGKAVHFFIDDYQFERIWNNPKRYIDKLSRYECVIAPDFSPYGDMPMATQIFNHYRKHWVSCFLQSYGINVIPCVRASTDERSLEWFLDGTPSNSILAYSSMWTKKGTNNYAYAEKEWNLMVEKLRPKKVFVYGEILEFMNGVEIEQIDTFSKTMRKRILEQ